MKNYMYNELRLDYMKTKSGRGDNNLHISDLSSLCSRHFIICHKEGVPFNKPQFIPMGLVEVFEQGNAIGNSFATRLARRNILIGIWECRICEKRYFGLMPKKCECEDKKIFKYHETEFVMDLGGGLFLTGHTDAVVANFSEKYSFIAECKSMKKEDYVTLEEPLLYNKYQVVGYLYIAKKSKNKEFKKIKLRTDEAIIHYVCKAFQKIPFKDFTIKYKDEKKIVKEIEENIKAIKLYFKERKMPERMCSNIGSKFASQCSVRDKCFKMRK